MELNEGYNIADNQQQIAHPSTHYIHDLVDTDAQNEGDSESISDLSDGFDEKGKTLDF